MSGSAVKRFGGLMAAAAIVIPTAEPPNRPTATLTIGRLHYDGGGDWYANPSSLPNLLTALRERTTLPVADRERVVTLTGPELWDVPLTHPIYNLVYAFPKGIPKIHEHDGLPAQGFGIFLRDRLVVYYSYQSDLGNGWEDPDVYHDPPSCTRR